MPDSLEEYTNGIYYDETGDKRVVHSVSVVGFGVEDDTKYWLVRNSWGSHWGVDGFFRVVRGVNNIAIEEDCAWAEPYAEPYVHETTEAEKNDARNNVGSTPI